MRCINGDSRVELTTDNKQGGMRFGLTADGLSMAFWLIFTFPNVRPLEQCVVFNLLAKGIVFLTPQQIKPNDNHSQLQYFFSSGVP
ncbi:hypothetical protein [Zooshikella ganghwensis]|uniref:Uncharacterized protein n=1 Tax=Zooshikella ganghwensis TaxID=202772 RepID=A0A4P9VR00_9GAMM|nr:hypothetical protein [Zooshikella ganghwensis]RDH44804.1 hypothetical protein B9G39_15935 [Zooshikella ganghwensis]